MGCWITSSMSRSKVTKVSSSSFRIQTFPLSLLPINPTLPVIRNCRMKVWRQQQFSIGKTAMWKVQPKTEWTLTRSLRNFWYKQSPDTTFRLLRQIKMRRCSLLTRVIFQALEGNETKYTPTYVNMLLVDLLGDILLGKQLKSIRPLLWWISHA